MDKSNFVRWILRKKVECEMEIGYNKNNVKGVSL